MNIRIFLFHSLVLTYAIYFIKKELCYFYLTQRIDLNPPHIHPYLQELFGFVFNLIRLKAKILLKALKKGVMSVLNLFLCLFL